MTDEELRTIINQGANPANIAASLGVGLDRLHNRMAHIGVVPRDRRIDAVLPAHMVDGATGELLADVLAAHPDPYYVKSTRSTREWAYRLRKLGWPVRHTKHKGGGYYLAVPVESDWRVQ